MADKKDDKKELKDEDLDDVQGGAGRGPRANKQGKMKNLSAGRTGPGSRK